MKKKFSKNLVLVLAAFCILLTTSCSNKPKSEQKKPIPVKENTVTLSEAQYQNAGIETAILSSQKMASLLKVTGKVDVPPQSMVSVSVPMGGYLKSTRLLEGTPVKKGSVLATMEDPQYIQLQQDYLTAKAQFVFNESEYNRQKELNQSKATSDKVYEQARANYQTQLVLTKSLEQKLLLVGLNPSKITANNIVKSINIYSPINGFVAAVNVNIGKYVNPSDVLFELVNPNDIHLSLSVFEKDVNKLAVGQKIWAYSNAHPDKKYPCEIVLISQNLSDQNAVEVHCHFDNYDKSLLPGMFMNAEIETEGKLSKALPEDAIVRFENKHYVFVANNNRQFEMKEVQIGNAENGLTEITDATALAGKKIVVKGAYNLLMALKNTNEE